MQHVIRSDQSFDEIEAQTIGALERHGLAVQRTFSLRSAIRSAGGDNNGNPGYSVLLLCTPGALRRPLGLLTLYERRGQIVINLVLTPTTAMRSSSPGNKDAATDANAELVAALVAEGLELCVGVVEDEECMDFRQV